MGTNENSKNILISHDITSEKIREKKKREKDENLEKNE